MVITTQTFRLRPGADREAFLAADKTMQEEVVYQLPGLLRRTVAYSADREEFLVVTLWAGEPGYHLPDFFEHALTTAVAEFVDDSSIAGASYEDIGG
jgi:hypothetical protein